MRYAPSAEPYYNQVAIKSPPTCQHIANISPPHRHHVTLSLPCDRPYKAKAPAKRGNPLAGYKSERRIAHVGCFRCRCELMGQRQKVLQLYKTLLREGRSICPNGSFADGLSHTRRDRGGFKGADGGKRLKVAQRSVHHAVGTPTAILSRSSPPPL